MSQPPSGHPDFTAPSFSGCYRHPDRSTGISCQRCGKPICGECMNPASVGFQCPGCIRRDSGSRRSAGWSAGGSTAGSGRSRQPRTVFGATLSNRNAPMTKIIMVTLAVIWVLDLISMRQLSYLLAVDNSGLAFGQYWRLVTFAVSPAGLLQVLMNLLVLWMAGQALEQLLGAWRFLALFVLSGVGGATVFFLLADPNSAMTGGSTAAVIGLLAANGVVKVKRREDVRGDAVLLALLVAYSFVVSGNWFWAALVGGILVGGLSGFVLAYAPRERRTVLQIGGLILVALLCLAAVVLKTVSY